MAYGPRSLPLSARRRLSPAQTRPYVISNLVGSPVTGDTVQWIFNVPITTGSGSMQGAFFVCAPYEEIFLIDLIRQDELTWYATDALLPISEMIWLVDPKLWRTSSNGFPIGLPIYTGT